MTVEPATATTEPFKVPRVSVLVITWNSAAVLRGMLSSLGDAAAGLDVEVVHVDNASTDDSASMVAGGWPGRLTQRVNRENLGFARGLKQAVADSRGDFLLVLNPDARLGERALRTLVDRLDSDTSVGIIGPLVRHPDGEVELVCARRMPGLVESLVATLGLRRFVSGTVLDPYTFRRSSYTRERDVPCVSGAAMLIRRSVLQYSGGVDDRCFMYFEDVDICQRVCNHGFRVRFCPSAEVTHISESSSPRTPELETWLATHNAAAKNVFFAVHRGQPTAKAHKALVGLEGAFRALLAAAGSGKRRRLAATGLAKLRWALRGEMPPGDPSGGSACPVSTNDG
jgi:N-acetylglucosaminyl-diphospho-decaprenol L-rhamnosyltransferase